MGASIRHLANDGNTSITGKTWPDIFATQPAATGTPEKFAVENNGDRALVTVQLRIAQAGGSDGHTMVRLVADTATLSAPYSFAAAVGPTGGTWGATGTRYWRITATNATGETAGSLEASFNVTDTAKKVTLTWAAVAGATGYKVYRSATSGVYTTPALRATLGAVTTYDDEGAAVGAGALPSANTTGGAAPDYGTPPSGWGVGPLAAGTLAIGRQWFYWANRVVPGGTPEAGNDRISDRVFEET